MQAEHHEQRRDLARDIRAERQEFERNIPKDRKKLRREIEADRKTTRKEHERDWKEIKARQAKGTEKLGKSQAKAKEKLDAKHAAERVDPKFAKKQTALGERQARQKARQEKEHAREQRQLKRDHKEERNDLREQHRETRRDERDSHRDQVEALRQEERDLRDDMHKEHLERVRDLETDQRSERAALIRERRGAAREHREERKPTKSLVNERDAIQGNPPTAPDLLARALLATGHADGWEADSLTGRQALDVLHAVRLEARRVLRSMAERVLAELEPETEEKALFGKARAAVAGFFAKAGGFIRETILAGVLAIAGPGPMTLAMEEGIERGHEVQLEYLDKFRAAVIDGGQPLDGTFVSRAEQYGSSVWGTSQEVVRGAAKKGGIFDQELRKHYGPDRPCATCREEVRKGWQPIGSLKAIGDSECLASCHCGFLYRKGNDGRPHIAGRGPLSEAAFGRTG